MLQVLTSIVVALLVDNEILDYNEKISSVWSEWAENGKDEGTVRDLMKHELGLPLLSTPLHPHDFSLQNIKNNMFGAMLEQERYDYQPGERRDYHVITRGMIATELVRRVDPRGRTVGEILRYHISEPLQADAYIGLQESELKRSVSVESLSPARFIINSLFSTEESKFPVSLGRMLTKTASMMWRGMKHSSKIKININKARSPSPVL